VEVSAHQNTNRAKLWYQRINIIIIIIIIETFCNAPITVKNEHKALHMLR